MISVLLTYFSHLSRFSATNRSSFISGYARYTLSISSFCPGDSPSSLSRVQTPSSRPCLRRTSCMPAIHPLKLFAASKNAALLSVILAARVSAPGTSLLNFPAWTSSSSLTALRVHTAQWPSSPPVIRFLILLPAYAISNSVSRSTRILSSLPVYRAISSALPDSTTPLTTSRVL